MSIGQKDFHDGLTLSQAIMLRADCEKRVLKKLSSAAKIPRDFLFRSNIILKTLRKERADPVLQPGDTIEVGN